MPTKENTRWWVPGIWVQIITTTRCRYKRQPLRWQVIQIVRAYMTLVRIIGMTTQLWHWRQELKTAQCWLLQVWDTERYNAVFNKTFLDTGIWGKKSRRRLVDNLNATEEIWLYRWKFFVDFCWNQCGVNMRCSTILWETKGIACFDMMKVAAYKTFVQCTITRMMSSSARRWSPVEKLTLSTVEVGGCDRIRACWG